MKNIKKIIVIALVLCLVLSLVGCGNKIGAVTKAFEDAGYDKKESSISAAIFNTFAESIASDEDGNVSYVAHTFANGLKVALVLEFKNTKALQEFYKEASNTGKGFIKDFQESDICNGNCIILTLSKDAVEVFKEA